ncbi:MAG: hypothetical protein ACLFV7_13400, partial [Phycisphaerae bacterium]
QVTHPDNPGRGFQNGFTGTHGNMHYQWIGRLTLKQGRLLNCTYFAEYAEGAKHRDQTFDNPLLDDWPHFKSGWPNLNTTRVEPHGLAIDAKGNVYVSAKGRRVITTSNAYQQMPSPLKKGTRGQWSDFVRVYTPGLTTLRYSSLLHGKWDWDTGKGGSPVDLGVVVPVEDGLVVVGTADVGKDSDKPEGDDMPVSNVPDWGQPTRHGRAGVVGRLTFDKQRPR